MQTAGHDVDGREVTQVGTMHLRAHIADMAFDVPDALSGSTATAKHLDITGVGLRIVGTDQAEEGRLARAVRA